MPSRPPILLFSQFLPHFQTNEQKEKHNIKENNKHNMGNMNSMSKAELAQTVAGIKDSEEFLGAVKKAQSKRKKQSSNSKKHHSSKEGAISSKDSLELQELRQIHEFVDSLRDGGKEGRELLDAFVQLQTGLPLGKLSYRGFHVDYISAVYDPHDSNAKRSIKCSTAA